MNINYKQLSKMNTQRRWLLNSYAHIHFRFALGKHAQYTDLTPTLIYERYSCMVVSGFLKAANHSVIRASGYCKFFFRLFTVLYFSVRSSRSSALRRAAILHECQNYLAGVGWGAVWEEARTK